MILLESTLGCLGLGDPDVISPGYPVNDAQRFIRVAWLRPVFTGAAIAVPGLALLGDAIGDLPNPHDVRQNGARPPTQLLQARLPCAR